MISLEEAKAMMTEDSMRKLKELVTPKPPINTGNKVNNDILMQALCNAVEKDVICAAALTDRLVKLLNSPTNTLSPTKLGELLTHLRETQPTMACVITLEDVDNIINTWVFTGPTCKFNKMFEYVVQTFNITPQLIRTKMTETLKPTIVNNIAQLLAKYETLTDDEKDRVNISITTVSRIVNMTGHMLFAEFKEM